MKIILIQTTCANKKEARLIAKKLIKKRLAACIQMSKIQSMYMWENNFSCNKEILLNIKTTNKNFKKVKNKIKELHNYDVPEIIKIDINNASKKYIKFIKKSCKEE